ncbi:MAG: hypothetical protein OES09_11790, partial [Gammaproteobacteria bacterium]|nr:hypothetical protein [Gammaproteobacteria bacterium]
MISTRFYDCTRFIALFGAIWGIAAAFSVLAAGEEDTRQKLDALRSKMRAIGADLRRDSGQRDRVRNHLERIERDISRLNRALRATERAAAVKREAFTELTATYRRHAGKQARQRRALGQLVNAKYRMGERDFVKMFLNQEDPAKLGRALAYYRYVAFARTSRIEAIEAALRETEALKQQVQAQQGELNALLAAQQSQQQSLSARQSERQTLLASLEQRIGAHMTELKQLQRDEARLEKLIEQIRAALSDLPSEIPAGTSFKQMRGRLSLPVNAKILARFGEPKSGADRWRGLFLDARDGQEVGAVFHGRVAFADWLRGFGL